MTNRPHNRLGSLGWLAFFCFTGLSRGEDIYVAQTVLGAGTGTTAADARAVSFFNTAGNWGAGAGRIGAGDTVHLVGTLATQLVIQGSGSSGAPITILFEPGAKLSAPYWTTAGAIAAFGQSFVTIDGNDVGVIENTANGTTLANQQLSWGISLENGSDLTIKRLTLRNFYVRTADSNDSTGAAGVGIRCINATSVSNLVIDANTITYGKFGIIVNMDGANNITVSNNSISRCSTMVAIAKGDANPSSGVVVTGNTFANGNYWDFTAGDIFHGDGLHMWTGAGPFLDVTVARNNMLTDWGAHTTGAIFLEGNYSEITIHNNLLGTLAEKMEAVMNIQGAYSGGTTAMICNNTVVGQATSNVGGNAIYLQSANWESVTFKNNIVTNYYSAIVLLTTQSVSALHFDYNDYYSLGQISGRIDPASGDQSGTSGDLAAWRAYLGSKGDEANGRAVNPFFLSTANYSLQASSPLRDTGFVLPPGFAMDLAGLSHGQGAGWDFGAYEFSTGGGVLPPSNAIVAILVE